MRQVEKLPRRGGFERLSKLGRNFHSLLESTPLKRENLPARGSFFTSRILKFED